MACDSCFFYQVVDVYSPVAEPECTYDFRNENADGFLISELPCGINVMEVD